MIVTVPYVALLRTAATPSRRRSATGTPSFGRRAVPGEPGISHRGRFVGITLFGFGLAALVVRGRHAALSGPDDGQMRMSEQMQQLVRQQGPGFVATVRPEGTPAVSPKGTTSVWNDEQLAFLHLHSPGTVANLANNPNVEVNAVDPIRRVGFRFAGRARVLTGGEEYELILAWFACERGTDRKRVQGAVLIDITAAERLISPVYDTGVSEADVVARFRQRHLDALDPDQEPR